MTYWKRENEGYILEFGTGAGETAISSEEYESIISAIKDKPTPPDGYKYRLLCDLSWELYELPTEAENEEETENE